MKLEWEETGQTGEIEYDGPGTLSASASLRPLLVALEKLRAASGASSFSVERQPGGTEYAYVWGDGARSFGQTIRMDQPTNPQMDFSTDFWRLSEFAPHRELRDLVLELIRSHAVSKIEVTWT